MEGGASDLSTGNAAPPFEIFATHRELCHTSASWIFESDTALLQVVNELRHTLIRRFQIFFANNL
jgi:hypothetical protein